MTVEHCYSHIIIRNRNPCIRMCRTGYKGCRFKNNGIMVTRKGGNQMVVYFGDEVAEALKNYMAGDREAATPLPGMNRHCFCQHRENAWVSRLLKIW